MNRLTLSAWALVSAGSVATGVGMVSLPGGLVVAGLLGFLLLYVAAYLDARKSRR